MLLLLAACATEKPASVERHIVAGGAHACLQEGTSFQCQFLDGSWEDYGQLTPPAGEWKAMFPGASTSCGIRPDGTGECWGNNSLGQNDVPEGTWAQLVPDSATTCGIHTDGTAACWGSTVAGQADVPPGTWLDITNADGSLCGVKSDHTGACWGLLFQNPNQDLAIPDREWVSVGGTGGICAMDSNGGFDSWYGGGGTAPVPEGDHYTQLVVGSGHMCVLDADGIAHCWGSNDYGQLEVPDKRFVELAAGEWLTCGLTAEGEVDCWGCRGDADNDCVWGTPATPYTFE